MLYPPELRARYEDGNNARGRALPMTDLASRMIAYLSNEAVSRSPFFRGALRSNSDS